MTPGKLEQDYEHGTRASWVGIISNILLFCVKLFAGIAGRSQAMVADAFHTLSDLLTSIAVLVGFNIASKPPDEHHPFGHGRAESIAAKIVSLILIVTGVGIAVSGVHVIIDKDFHDPGWIALIAAVFSIVIKEISFRYVIKVSREIRSTSLEADAYHHRSDALSSIAAFIGIAGAKMGYTYLDPLAAIVVAGFIIKNGADVFHKAYDELMDAAPPDDLMREIEAVIRSVNGVEHIDYLGVRKTGIEFFISVTVCVDGSKTVLESHEITMLVEEAVRRKLHNVKDITIHVEPCK
ncbi:MAG: cation diffusion facilitator family transporter [Candidatus Omnitrophica bacterium]|nr:cation diffusion facilitator family transporter [Candidatus Omnitrophota bacterium]MDD5488786.1 cation diffusion facilitator family transporter [Candidatus Omnitrophota bacterium]